MYCDNQCDNLDVLALGVADLGHRSISVCMLEITEFKYDTKESLCNNRSAFRTRGCLRACLCVALGVVGCSYPFRNRVWLRNKTSGKEKERKIVLLLKNQ